MSVIPYEHDNGRAWVALQNPATELANAISNTDFVPKALRGNPAAITAAILYGDEIGFGPMQSLAKISMIDGKPSLSAEGQRAKILSEGHDIWIEESTNTKCTVAGRRKDSDQTSRVTWTLDDAKRAKIAGKNNWQMYPRQMLLARASAELARAIFADAIGGLAATEELEDGPVAVLDGAPPAPLTPEPKRRRRAQVTAAPEPTPEPSPEPEPEPEPEEPPPEPASWDDIPKAMKDRLMANFRERGFETSEQRHSFASFMLGRDVQSSVELSEGDVSQLITILEAEPRQRERDEG